MTSTLCQSAALDRIAVFFHTVVKTILMIAEIVRTTLAETMGRQARLLRHRTGFLPPSASALYADIGAAPVKITDSRKVDLDVFLSAEIREAWQATSPQVLLDRSREGPMVTMPREYRERAADLSSRKVSATEH